MIMLIILIRFRKVAQGNSLDSLVLFVFKKEYFDC